MTFEQREGHKAILRKSSRQKKQAVQRPWGRSKETADRLEGARREGYLQDQGGGPGQFSTKKRPVVRWDPITGFT